MKNMNKQYFEDFVPGEVITLGSYPVSSDEILDYANKWDPQPLHMDPEAAKSTPFGGLIACGTHVFAISVRLLVTQKTPVAVIAALGLDEVRFSHPVRPGDVLTLIRECLEVRPSKSKSYRGIVRNNIRLVNQNGEQVLSYIDTILVAKRSA